MNMSGKSERNENSSYRKVPPRVTKRKFLAVLLAISLVLSMPGGLLMAEEASVDSSGEETEVIAQSKDEKSDESSEFAIDEDEVDNASDDTDEIDDTTKVESGETEAIEEDGSEEGTSEGGADEPLVEEESSDEETAVGDEEVAMEGSSVVPLAPTFTAMTYPGSDLPADIVAGSKGYYSYSDQASGTIELAYGTYAEGGSGADAAWFLAPGGSVDTSQPMDTATMLNQYANLSAAGFLESTPSGGTTPTFYSGPTTETSANTIAGTRTVWNFVDKATSSVSYYRVYGSFGGVEGFYESDQYGNVSYLPALANTSLDEIIATGSGSKPVGTTLPDDAAYISSLRVINIVDGTVPFDADNAAGNDESKNNLNVRTYDSVSYTLEYITAIQDTAYAGFESGRVYVQFELDADAREAEFATSSMGWLIDAKVQYRVGSTLYNTIAKARTASENAGGATITQVLTGYRQLDKPDSSPVALPGTGTLSATVNVKSMKNGDEIEPRFIAWTTGNDPDPTKNSQYGSYAEAKEAKADKVKVSAAPRYNIRLSENTYTGDKGSYDFSEVSGVVNSDKGTVHGRVYGYNITVQLYNTSADKGLKGIELPQGEITFDVDMNFQAKPMGTADSAYVNITNKQFEPDDGDPDNYYDANGNSYTPMPLLWDYRLAVSDTASVNSPNGAMGRSMKWLHNFSGSARTSAVLGKGGGQTSCFSGGKWTAMQSGNTLSFVVDGYSFADTLERGISLPTRYYGSAAGAINYRENIGCFSAGSFQIIQPLPKNSADMEKDVDFRLIVNEYNMKASSLSNQAMGAQGSTSDDRSTRTVYMKAPGSYKKYLNLYPTTGTAYLSSTNIAGDAWRSVGDTFYARARYDISASTDPDAYVFATNILVKLDNRYIEVIAGQDSNSVIKSTDEYATKQDISVLYVGRSGGWDSGNEENQINFTREEDPSLRYYTSIDELTSAGDTCVGFLLEGRGDDNTKFDNPGAYSAILPQMKVKENADIGEVAMFVHDVRLWTLEDYGLTNGDIPSRSTAQSIPAHSVTLDSGDASYVYSKSTYDETGLTGGHGGSRSAGQSLLIVGSKATINKSIDQIGDDSSTHMVFHVSNNQRYVDFALSPQIELNNQGGLGATTTTVTITDTLPEGLTYMSNSTTFGGTYEQSTPRGKKGSIIGGLSGSTYEPSVATNSDGQQVLTWVIDDVTIGSPMDIIHFSCVIGTPGDDSTDVEDGDQLLNTVIISSTEDMRAKSAANGNLATQGLSIVKLDAAALVKSVNPSIYEVGETINFALAYSNTGTQALTDVRLMDVLPYVGDGRGTDFNGSYTLNSSLTLTSSGTTNFDLYYTTNTAVRSKTARDYTVAEIEGSTDGWTKASKSGSTFTIAGSPVAIMLVGSMNAGSSFSLGVPLKPSGNHPADVYGNNATMLTAGMTENVEAVTVQAAVVNRIVSGLAWYDANGNGIREKGELLLENVTVSLVKAGSNTLATDVLGNPVQPVQTGTDGSYRFVNLAQGNYDIKFSDDLGSFPIANYEVTKSNIGNDTKDSDIDSVLEIGDPAKLSEGIIQNISLPAIGGFTYFTYESANNDGGFTQSVTQALSGTKTYTDTSSNSAKAMTAGQFNFEVRDAVGTVVATGTNDASGNITFSPDLTLFGAGDHTFTVTEVQGSGSGIEYDTKSVLVTVSVQYANHKLSITGVSYKDRASGGTTSNASGITFDNEFIPGRANIVANKAVKGDGAPSISTLNGKFEFTIEGTDANGRANMPATTTVTNVGSDVSFGGINYHAAGTYSYQITETAISDSDPQWRMDTAIVNVVVTVAPSSSGDLEATVVYSGGTGADSNTFTNTYIKPVEAGIVIAKSLTNAAGTDPVRVPDIADLDGAFSFTIEAVSANASALLPTETTLSNTGGTASFAQVSYKEAGEYEYKITENAMPAGELHWITDTREILATVSVVEVTGTDGNPALEATVSYAGGEGNDANGFVNTFEYLTVDVSGVKSWDDEDNSAGLRPDKIEVSLRADGVVQETITVTEADGWAWSWTELPKLKSEGGIISEIVYSVTETPVDEYATQIDGFNITNSYTPGKTSRTVVKVWEDYSDKDELRPDEISVQLLANGDAYGDAVTLNAGVSWRHTWNDLPVLRDGKPVAYTAEEIKVPEGYEVTYSDDGFTLTNTHVPVNPDIVVVKDVDKEKATLGEELTYTLTLTNTGDGAAAAVRVRDYIPKYTTFVSVDENGAYVEGDSPYVEWFLESIAPGEVVSMTFVVKINEDVESGTVVENIAHYGSDDTDEKRQTNKVETPVEYEGTTPPTLTDEKGKPLGSAPKTGDAMATMGYALLALASCAAVVSIVAFLRRKKKKQF